jgi:peptidylprolyl isomerase
MTQAKRGDAVKIHYTGRLQDGTVFDSSRGKEPLEFTLGDGRIIPGLEEAVEGMKEGESREADIPSDQAYGPRRDELLVQVERERLPSEIEPEPGLALQMRTPEGNLVPVVITQADEEVVVMDANHPLAGKDLSFELESVEIV